MNDDSVFLPQPWQNFVGAARAHAEQGKVGRRIRSWANSICPPNSPDASELASCSEDQLSRLDLRTFCGDMKHTEAACFCSIMAWGGMRADHARKAWGRRTKWIPVLRVLRTDPRLTRAQSFEKLKSIRTCGELPGLQPAFYTKLIYFLREREDGYIMDQWTAKSVNLLVGKPIVQLNKQGYVTDANTPEDYERFCHTVDLIADRYRTAQNEQLTGGQIEERLFSKRSLKGRPETWRDYVRKQWRPMRLIPPN